MTPTILRPHHTGLTVQSLQRSLEFYRDILGFVEVFSWNPQEPYIGELVGYPSVDLHATVLRLAGSEVYLELLEYRNVEAAPVNSANGNPGTAHIAFFVDNLDLLYQRLKEQGVGSVSDPVTPTIGPNKDGRAVYMVDPDGFRIELIQARQSFADYGAASD